MTPQENLQPAIDPDLLKAGFAPPPLRKIVRGADKLKGASPELIDHWNNLQGEFDKAGVSPVIKSGYRTTAQQQALYNNPLTRAKTKGNDGIINISPHQEGRALDISFAGPQKAKGHQIIADYAKRSGLHVPSDEPWHIAIPKQKPTPKTAPDIDPDLLNAGYESEGAAVRPQSNIDPELLAAGMPQKTTLVARTKSRDPFAGLKGGVEAVAPDTGMGALRRIDDPEVQRINRVQRQVTAQQDPAEKNLHLRPGARVLDAQPTENEEVLNRVKAEQDQETQQREAQARYERDKPKIDELAKQYRKAIRTGSSVGQGVEPLAPKWKAETLAKGGAGLAEFLSGAMRESKYGIPQLLAGSDPSEAADYIELHSQALQQAAEEEGADRNAASKFAQDVVGGFIGSAPELAAMGVGIPAPVAFGVGSGTRAYGGHRPVAPAVVHGAATGAAFEIPVGGQGFKAALKRAGTVGAATTGIDVASGQPLGQALKSGATNALMVGAPEVMRGGRNARQAETQRQSVSPEQPAESAPVHYGDNPKPGANVGGDVSGIRDSMSSGDAPNNEPRQRFFHRDWGEVEVVPDQTGARAGRVKVAEVDNPERQHFPKKADLRGVGNSRMVPIKEPVEVQPQPATAPDVAPLPAAAQPTGVETTAPASPQGPLPTGEPSTPSTPKEVIEAAGLKYKGPQRMPKGRPDAHMLDAPDGSTLMIVGDVTPETVAAKIAEHSAKPVVEPTEKGETTKIAPTSTLEPGAKESKPQSSAEGVESTKSTPTPPDFVKAAQARKAARAAEKAKGIEYRHSGIDPTELLDDIIIRGHEIYSQTIKPTYQEWSRKIREEFGPQANQHLKNVWGQLAGSAKAESELTGIKNAITESERESRGLDPIEKQMYDGVGDAVLKGKKAIEEGRIDPRSLARDRALKPKALTAEETGALAVYKANLVREQDAALNQIENAITKNDPRSLAEWRERERDLDQQRDTLDAALERSGRDNSAALNARKALIDREDNLVTIIRKARAAKGGEITDEMRSQLTQLTTEIEALKKKLTTRASKVSDPVIARIQNEIARDARREKRATTKAELDSEFEELSAQFGRLAGRANIGIDPQLAVLIGKMAKNRVMAGGNALAGIVDEIHSKLKDRMEGLSREDVESAITAYGKQVPDADRVLSRREGLLKKQIADIEARIAKNDLAAKQQRSPVPDNAETARLKTQRDALNRVLADLRKPVPDPLKGQKTRLQNQVTQLEDQVNRNDFTKPERPRLLPDRETKDLQNRLADLRERRDKKIESNRKVSKWDMLARYTVGWSRAAKLMYTGTLGKLTSAAAGRIITSPVEEIWGAVPSKIFPELAKRAPREGHLDIGAEVRAISELYKSDVWRETWRKLTAGRTSEDIMYGGKKGDMEFLSLPGRVHGALKEPVRQVEQTRAFEKRLTHAARSGVDISDPQVQMALYGEAYVDSNRAIFQQPNALSDGFSDLMRKWSKGSGFAKAGAHAGRFLFPITKVPVNIVSEVSNYTLGLPRAAALTAKAYRNGFKDLTPQQADSIMRSWKKGGVGLGVMMLGFFNPDKFGGYYQKGDKRTEDEVQAAEIKWLGVRIPKWATHVPIIEAAQIGATIRRVIEAKKDRGLIEASAEGALAAGKGLASEVPFYETPARFFTGQEGTRGVTKFAGEQARGMVPGFIQEGAKVLDKGPSGQTTKRTPTGTIGQRFGQTVELGIPGLRENVPISSVFGSKATKATDEAQRLGVAIKGAEREPNEPADTFKVREERENRYIRKMLESVVALPGYAAETDARKAKWLKKAKGQAVEDANRQRPEEPEKPEEPDFPIPEVDYSEPKPRATLTVPRGLRRTQGHTFKSRLQQGARV